MFKLNNFFDNPNIKPIDQKGCFQIIEHQADLSLTPSEAASAYFSTAMNVKKRQALATLNGQNSVILSAGAMQWMAGQVQANNGVKGVADFAKKAFSGATTGESAIKPTYFGNGIVSLEPTYKHLLLEDIRDWNGGIVMDDGLFLACEGTLQQRIFRKEFSAAITSGMDLFNLALQGQNGYVLLESPVSRNEIVEVFLDNDTLTVDGDLVIAWSPSIRLTVTTMMKRGGLVSRALSSSASGEGLVNVFQGTGKILLAPTL